MPVLYPCHKRVYDLRTPTGGVGTYCERGKTCGGTGVDGFGISPSWYERAVNSDLEHVVRSIKMRGLGEEVDILAVWIPAHYPDISNSRYGQ
jgi:hypothetical protein